MTAKHFIQAVITGRFSALLASIVALFLLSPLMPGDQGYADRMFGVFIMFVLASCLRAISRTRRFFIFMVFFTLVTMGISGIEMFCGADPAILHKIDQSVKMVYFAIVFFSIMRYVLDGSSVTSDKICGAISAYLVMGIAWAFVYNLFHLVDPSSFDVPAALVDSSNSNSTWALYFSFTTLTTLGYGDITPLKPSAQSYAIMQAVIGQIYLAVIIARLIALHISHEHDDAK